RIALSRTGVASHPLQGPTPVEPGSKVVGIRLKNSPKLVGGLLIAPECGESDPEVQPVSPGVWSGCKERLVTVGRPRITPERLEDPCFPGECPGIVGTCFYHL